jgi:hypothetical protein
MVCFIDNDSKKWEKILDGYPIIPPHKIPEMDISCIVITTNLKYEKEIREQIKIYDQNILVI